MSCESYIKFYSPTLLERPEYANCDFPKQFAAGKLDSKLLKTLDCPRKICVTVLESNKPAFSLYPGCSLPDSAYGNAPLELATLSSLCSGIAIAESGVVGAATTSRPSSLPPASMYPPPNSPSSGREAPSKTGMIVGVCAGALVALAVAAFVLKRSRSKHKEKSTEFLQMEDGVAMQRTHKGDTSTAQSAFGLLGEGASGELDFGDLELFRIPATAVHLEKTLASGAFGQVWLGEYHGQPVAVKTLLSNRVTKADLQKFIWEIALVAKIECQYVVTFIGVSWSRPTDMQLITEFMDGGDLRSALQSNHDAAIEQRRLTWKAKVSIAHRVAEGLVYLHSMDPRVIHRDLKSRNILLDSSQGAKITDFGISRETSDATMTAGIGTYRWMAPEVLKDGHYTELTDLFSFGVILSELDTEVLPYSDLRNDKGNPLTDTAIMAKVMAGELRPHFTAQCPEWFVTLGRNCTALHPMDRPTAMEVAYVLRQHLKKL